MNARTSRVLHRSAPAKTYALLLLLQAAACTAEPPARSRDSDSVPTAGQPSDSPGGAPTPSGGLPPAGGQQAPTPATGRPSTPPDGWTIGSLEAEAVLQASWPIPILRAVRTGTNDGFDRMTIELGDGEGVPGYHVEYVDRPLIQCGSGNQIFPVGDAWLEVRLEPAQAHTDEGRPTLTGREIPAEQRVMRRIYVTCDFEGVVTVAVAVDSPNPFRVSTLSAPRRIVVDVRH